jgi:hypothetical protein
MNAFDGEMCITPDHHQRERPYPPSLPLLDISNLFNQIPQEGPWQIPKSFHQEENWEDLLLKWCLYLKKAERGNLIFLIAIQTNIVDGTLEDTQAAEYFNDVLPAETYEERLEKVLSVQRVFVALLSEKSQKYLKLEGNDTHASPKDIQNARTLVKNFESAMWIPDLPDEEEDD